MNSLTHDQMRQHVPIVAWLNIAGAIIMLLIAAFLLILLPSIGADLRRPRRRSGVLSIVGVSVGGFLAVLGAARTAGGHRPAAPAELGPHPGDRRQLPEPAQLPDWHASSAPTPCGCCSRKRRGYFD